MLRYGYRYGYTPRAEADGAPDPDATVPEAFALADWELDDTTEGGTLAVTINELPDDGGDNIIRIDYRVDSGSWVSSGGIIDFEITGLTNDVVADVELRAVNGVGASDASDVKSATPTDDAPEFIVRMDFSDERNSQLIALLEEF